MTQLGRLKQIQLRDAWKNEASDFTPWLAQTENIELLGEAIGLELEVETTEKGVGPFSADILCKIKLTGDPVLIENQLERTDHTHLGQLLTYAAGLDAVNIVWVASKFTDEHRAALDWLNEQTAQNINFFGLEIELWQIGESLPAPKFNVISKPNNWTRNIKGQTENKELTEYQKTQISFWTAFKEFQRSRSSKVEIGQPQPWAYGRVAIGRSGFYLCPAINIWEKLTKVMLVLDDNNAKPHFHLLHQQKETIEQVVGTTLNWDETPQYKSCYITLVKNVDVAEQSTWPEIFEWMDTHLDRFHKAFAGTIRTLKAEGYLEATAEPEDEVMP